MMKPKITMRSLNNQGRWGNQAFEYALIRVLAKKFNADYEVSPWVGESVFGRVDPHITSTLPNCYERNESGVYSPTVLTSGREYLNHNFVGYGQLHTSWFAPHEEFIRGLFELSPEWRHRLNPAIARLRAMGTTLVGLHQRTGDTGRFIFYITPPSWYLQELEKLWSTLHNPVLFVAAEDESFASHFAKYNPQTAKSLGVDLKAVPMPVFCYLKHDLRRPTPISMDFLPDWHLLRSCDVLLLPNSTFSFSAAMLGNPKALVRRSRLSTQAFETVVPWNDYPLTYEDLRQHPGISGTELVDNHYWHPVR